MTMTLVDTHSHLYEPEFDDDRDAAVGRAVAAGVRTMLLPAIDSESHGRMFSLARTYPDAFRVMMGLHPTSVNDNPHWRDELATVERLLDSPPEGIRFVGVGEIGLDFYWSQDFKSEQAEAFRAQCRLALRHDLPIAVHTRNAYDEMAEIVGEFRGQGLRGVFHAFNESAEVYRRLRECGDFLFGIGGVVTYKRAQIAETIVDMQLDDIVLETDCPYLTPVPYRGKRNESAYVAYVCGRVAELKGVPESAVAAATTGNARRMFAL